MRNDVSEPDTLWGTIVMSRDIVDKPASQLLFVLGAGFFDRAVSVWAHRSEQQYQDVVKNTYA